MQGSENIGKRKAMQAGMYVSVCPMITRKPS